MAPKNVTYISPEHISKYKNDTAEFAKKVTSFYHEN